MKNLVVQQLNSHEYLVIFKFFYMFCEFLFLLLYLRFWSPTKVFTYSKDKSEAVNKIKTKKKKEKDQTNNELKRFNIPSVAKSWHILFLSDLYWCPTAIQNTSVSHTAAPAPSLQRKHTHTEFILSHPTHSVLVPHDRSENNTAQMFWVMFPETTAPSC